MCISQQLIKPKIKLAIQYLPVKINLFLEKQINMPFKICLFIIILFSYEFAHAQYYYKDILNNSIAAEEIKDYKKANIHFIKIKSFEADGQLSENFFCEKKISKNYRKSTLITKSTESGKSIMETFFNADGLIEKTYDSSETLVNTNFFYYNDQNKLIRTFNISKSNDDDFVVENSEDHLYFYDELNRPVKMFLVKNSADTAVILFSNDEKGNTAFEKNTKSGIKYYYYYNDQNKLTDIVHSDKYSDKMRADYIFEYNENGQLDKMITTGDANSLIWKYDYENNIRIKERFFNATQKYLGKIEYEYK